MKLKILIVDDSLFVRAILRQMIESDPKGRFEVVATAIDGLDAIQKLEKTKVDVITMDVEMPKLNGIEAVKRIMEENPTPIVMLSSLTKKGAKETNQSLFNGAVDFLEKPSQGMEITLLKDEIWKKLEIAGSTKIKGKKFRTFNPKIYKNPNDVEIGTKLTNLIAIGCSTGGPNALRKVMAQLPKNLPAGILIVQHMPEGSYTSSLADHLNQISNFKVEEAKNGDELLDGKAYIAPGGYHLELIKRGDQYRAVTNKNEPVTGHRPSVDNLFYSIAKINLDINLYCVVLTGMGSDGTKGLESLKQKKPTVFAESEKTSVVFGMPKKAIEGGNVNHVEDLEMIIPRLSQIITKKQS